MEWRFVFVPSSWFSLYYTCNACRTSSTHSAKLIANGPPKKRKEFNALRNQKRMSDEN